jgi:hypothetical protein
VWDFGNTFFEGTNCRVDTFDCTGAHGNSSNNKGGRKMVIPMAIRERAFAHEICLGTTKAIKGTDPPRQFMKMSDMNEHVSLHRPPDYFKIDIEGNEWRVFEAMLDNAVSSKAMHAAQPDQIFGEFHLDRPKALQKKYVGVKLRNFIGDMFRKGGYMVMFDRVTIQTRNHDYLFTKVLCPVE